uniref:Uncharacterized protein n=1 Tax=Ascaris lumbricoides TaxID=6252 RepID=A0A0M3I5H0_ASCLU
MINDACITVLTWHVRVCEAIGQLSGWSGSLGSVCVCSIWKQLAGRVCFIHCF